ncbi:NAD-dependent epimerase/dehydratase family protein [Pararobbsia silviterrae]|uniref:NAD-dependent epimerase/dehydratase family protein n=1 Tax=Pararobbsia silviterrae TaxID=1792498 RepID=A0A494Y9Z2_9BURK|nr:NAD-dependent epimerase/dehydratase family protein [Pararobbsia silviterrae]RKP56720.1 NAD-dependent epimerase/dehydratase family protein [Pararobbsia silviterrae]
MIRTRKLRRPRVLVVGAGHVGLRCVTLLRDRYRVFALTRDDDPARLAALREAGAVPVAGDLDRRRSLHRAARLANTILDLAPPPASGARDPRSEALIAALARARGRAPIVPERRPPTVVYASTTGVYGDCGGARVDETRPVRPANPRAVRRVAAERAWRAAGARRAVDLRIVRIPGIYSAQRLPVERLRKGTPALAEADDVFTSHIHADDLAAIVIRAARAGRPQRVYLAADDTRLRMADYFDLVADRTGLPRPPRIARSVAEAVLEPVLLSFMRESRRIDNGRLKHELGYRLRFPTVEDFFDSEG